MIEYPKDEDGFISDMNLPEEQMINFKMPKLIHGKIESFYYLTVAKQFKQHVQNLNNQFMLTSIKEIEEVNEFLNNPQSKTQVVALHFLSHSFEVILLNNKGKTYSTEEYDVNYLDEEDATEFINKIHDSKEYQNWLEKHQIKKGAVGSANLSIFFDRDCFNNILTTIIYEESFEQYQAINLDETLINQNEKIKNKKVKV